MITPGSIIGHRYRVQEMIGSGGMACVYKALNLSNHKYVAIKVLKEEFINDEEFLRRFQREAKAVLHLSHENIVHAYGVGEYEGLPYIVLEYVEGSTLKQIITENGPMPPRLAVAFAVQVLNALSAAHHAGIIHRDVKPQNVIVTPEGAAKLTDFGIARDVDANTVTYAGGSTILGSVHYLSPEQAKGKPVTAGSDLYSVGIMLYEMLTGQVPFDSDNSVAIALMHLHDDPVPPIQLNPKISPALNDVVLRALNKNLSERYASAGEMIRQLKRALQEPNSDFARTYTPESTQTVKKRKKKKQMHSAVSIAIPVAALVIIVIGIFLVTRGSYTEDDASMELVPILTGRSIEDAEKKAADYGFTVNLQEYETSETVPCNEVMLQSPESGVKSKRGTAINVIVSLGPDAPVVPNLSGMTPDEAKSALESVGLKMGTMDYRVSNVAIGYVCAQSIVYGTEVNLGTSVNISVSATSVTTFEMPLVTEELLNIALGTLSEAGFTSVFVRYDDTSDQEDGMVLVQTPVEASEVLPETPVYLTVSGSNVRPFAADVASNLDIQKDGTEVLFAVPESFNGAAYYRIVYETKENIVEKKPISFTAYSDTEGTRELVRFENGVEVKRQDVGFTSRES